jgi:acyl carrier protein
VLKPKDLEKLQSIFREVFDRPDLTIYDSMQAKDVDGWDSLNHVTLIMAIEEGFRVRFSTREVMSFQNVGEMIACLDKKMASAGRLTE